MPPYSSNFEFLARHDRRLASLGAFAERYFKEDPGTCLVKLRQFGELLAQLAAKNFQVALLAQESQIDVLRRLEYERAIPGEELACFHRLRKAGNVATHYLHGGHADALVALKSAHQLGIWFCRRFGNKQFSPGPFVTPPDPTTFGSMVGPGKQRITKLTEDQYSVLDGLAEHVRAAIRGGAGTGKTVLALEKAQRLARHGADTLLICYSEQLGVALKEASRELGLPNLRVQTYNEYAEAVCRSSSANISLPPSPTEADRSEYYERRLPETFREALSRSGSPRFDAIVVDEAQDFAEIWMETLELSLRDPPNSCWYIFYDDNQNVFRRGTKFMAKFPVRFRLVTNLRNAPAVFSRFEQFYHDEGDGAFRCGNDCEGKVSFHPEITDRLAFSRFVSDLAKREALDPSDIVLLSCASVGKSRFQIEEVVAALKTKQPCFAGMKATSVRKFKGLESPVVMLTDLESAGNEPEVLYTAISRAQLRLCVIGLSELPSQSRKESAHR